MVILKINKSADLSQSRANSARSFFLEINDDILSAAYEYMTCPSIAKGLVVTPLI